MPALADTQSPATARPRWADLRLRVLSAAVLAPLALACLWVGGWAWDALVAVVTVGLVWEWSQMCRLPPALLGTRQLDLVAGLLYVGAAVLALLWLRADPTAGRGNVLFVLLIVWASDIGAYLVGRLVGGPKLAPAISPGKTWSGAAGGLLAGALAGVAVAGDVGVWAIVVAATLSVVSQAGDLLESAIKRHFGVKDSSHLIPGHGGLFDRLDGVLAAAPAAAALALLRGHGGMLWQ